MLSQTHTPEDRTEREFEGLVVAHAAVYGGMMANFGRGFASRLIEGGADLHFFASRWEVFGCRPPIEELEAMGGRFHGLPISDRLNPLLDTWALVAMAASLRRHRVRILHTRSSKMGAVGRLAAKLAGVPIVIHHQDDLHSRENRLSPSARRVVAYIERQLAGLSDRSLFISDAVIQDAVTIGFPENRCVKVGLDLNEVFEEAATNPEGDSKTVRSALARLGVPKGKKIVGCIGRLVHHKGIDLFISAAEHLAPHFPDWVFLVKGDGPLHEAIEKGIRDKGLSERVFLMTRELPGKDLPELYRAFEVFVLPTRREGFGLVFAEAMAMGIPVVGPRMAPVTEVVPQDCGVLVEGDSLDALVEALLAVMTDEGLRQRLSAKGKAHALRTWCKRASAERVVDVYRELLVSNCQ